MIARLLISPSLEIIKAEVAKTLASHLTSGNSNPITHPDVLYFSLDAKLGIAEARKIKEHFSLKPYSAKGRVVIAENASVLTPEAQNALLKTLEELPKEALFILGANSDAKFLPTILSRCQTIILNPAKQERDLKVKSSNSSQDLNELEKLIRSNIEERFEYIEKLKEKEEFLRSLTLYFHQNVPSHSDFLKELLQAEEWANQNVNIRAILEYLMLVMPNKL